MTVQTDLNINLHIETWANSRLGDNFHNWKYYHYKTCAAYAVTLTNEGTDWIGTGRAAFANIEVFDNNGIGIASSREGSYGLTEGSDIYPAMRYVLQAVTNEQHRIQSWGDEWLSPTEIEAELNVQSGTVRQYINRNREALLDAGLIKDADGRTVLMKRGKALNIWQTRRYEFVSDTNEWAQIVDIASPLPVWRDRAPLLAELYDVLSADESPVKNNIAMINEVPYLVYHNEFSRLDIVKRATRYLSKQT